MNKENDLKIGTYLSKNKGGKSRGQTNWIN